MRMNPTLLGLALVVALALAGCGDDTTDVTAEDPAAAPADGGDDAAVPADGGEPPGMRMMAVLPVAEVLGFDEGTAAAVEGVIVGDASGYRICAALLESMPPQCGGEQLAVTDGDALLEQLQAPLAVEGEVAWSEQPVVVWGYRRGADGFEPDPAASGADVVVVEGDETQGY